MRYLIVAVLISFLNICSYSQIYIPTAFTPNGDGDNDVFVVTTGDTLTLFDLTIFNLNGEKVCHMTNTNQVWVGGDNYYAPNGTYVYKLIYRKEYNITDTIKKGIITVIR